VATGGETGGGGGKISKTSGCEEHQKDLSKGAKRHLQGMEENKGGGWHFMTKKEPKGRELEGHSERLLDSALKGEEKPEALKKRQTSLRKNWYRRVSVSTAQKGQQAISRDRVATRKALKNLQFSQQRRGEGRTPPVFPK